MQPLAARARQALHRLRAGRAPSHRCQRHRVVREGVHAGARGNGLQRDEPQRRRRELQVADEQLALLRAPLAARVHELVAHDAPRAEAGPRAVARCVRVDHARVGAVGRRHGRSRGQRHADVIRLLELDGPPQQIRAHPARDHDGAAARAELRTRRAPRRVQPYPPVRVARGGERQLAQQRDEVVGLARLRACHRPRCARVRLALALRQAQAPLHEVNLGAQQLWHVARRLLLARLRLVAELLQHVAHRLEVQLRARHRAAVARERRARRVDNDVVDAQRRLIVDVHAGHVQRSELLGDLFLARARCLARCTPFRQPRQHARVARRVLLIHRAQCAAESVHEHVGEARALGSICRAAKAAALVDDEAVARRGRIPPHLGELTAEALVIRATIHNRRFDWHARRLHDGGCLGHLAHAHHARARPAGAVHRVVERRYAAAIGAPRAPAVIICHSRLDKRSQRRAHSLGLVDDRVGVAPYRPVRERGVRLRPALGDQRGELLVGNAHALQRARVRRTEQRAPRRRHVVRDAGEDLRQDALVGERAHAQLLRHARQVDVARRLHARDARRLHRHRRLAPRERPEVPDPRRHVGQHGVLGRHPQVGRPHVARRAPLARASQPDTPPAAPRPDTHASQPLGLEQLLQARDRRRALRLRLRLRPRLHRLRRVESRDRSRAQLRALRLDVPRHVKRRRTARARHAIVVEVQLVRIGRPHVQARAAPPRRHHAVRRRRARLLRRRGGYRRLVARLHVLPRRLGALGALALARRRRCGAAPLELLRAREQVRRLPRAR